MTRFLRLLATVSLLTSALVSRADGQTEANRPFLWEVKGSKSTVYLAGSVHLLREQDLPYPSLLQTAFERADQVTFEINLDEATSLSVLLLTVTKGTYSPPDSVKAHLTPETYALLDAYRKANNVTAPDLYRPWLISQALTETELTRAGFAAKYGVDQHFFDAAKKAGKPILALESTAFQINVLADLPEEGQIAGIQQFLENPAKVVSDTVSLVESWKRGDAESVRARAEAEFINDPVAFDRLLTQRNKNWMPTIEGYLQSAKTTLVIVGAAHLLGDQGLVTLLQQRGYDLAQLPPTPPILSPPTFLKILKQADSLQLNLQLEMGQSYILEKTSDWRAWTNVVAFAATNLVQTLETPLPASGESTFWRLRTP